MGTDPEPSITDPIPDEPERKEYAGLVTALDERLPAKTLDHNLLVATWNICAFSDVTRKWRAGKNDSPRRDYYAARCIAEIISRFDVVAVQEVKGNLAALRCVMQVLGDDWQFMLTDETRGRSGNNERMAFLFDSRKVRLSGLACELVIADESFRDPEAPLRRQFARTPYAVSFRCGEHTFVLVTLHVLWGSEEARIGELTMIAQWLKDWAAELKKRDHDLIVLGDFNIPEEGDELYKAFTGEGLAVPEHLQKVPRTVSADPNKPHKKYYDQIAWFTGDNQVRALSLKYLQAGHFDFSDVVLKCRELPRGGLKSRMSDHYPLWVEFSVREEPALPDDAGSRRRAKTSRGKRASTPARTLRATIRIPGEEDPPEGVVRELEELSDWLNEEVPRKQLDRNLVIGCWNVNMLGDVLNSWQSAPKKGGARDKHCISCMAEIISRFDVIALVELAKEPGALQWIAKVLGSEWSVLLTDVSTDQRSRMAFVFDTRRVVPAGVVCELVLSPQARKSARKRKAVRQFRRPPYAAAFRSRGKTFTLVVPHIALMGTGPRDHEKRAPQLRAFAEWVEEWAQRSWAWDHNLIAVGDFNVFHRDDVCYQALVSTGLTIPPELDTVPRSVCSYPEDPYDWYDIQMAWFPEGQKAPALGLQCLSGGSVDLRGRVLTNRTPSIEELKSLVSDTLPLWVEFSVRD